MPPQAFDSHAFAALVASAPDGVIVVDADGNVRFANRAVGTILGYDPNDLVGRRYALLVPDALRAEHEAFHRSYLDHPTSRPMGNGLRITARHRHGHDVPVSIALVPVPTDGRLVAAFIRDVTDHERLLSRVEATNELLMGALRANERTEILAESVRLARHLVDGSVSWIAVAEGDGDSVTAVVADGPSATDIVGRSVRTDGRVLDAAKRLLLDGSDTDPPDGRGAEDVPIVLVPVPMSASSGPVSIMAVAGRDHERTFDAADRDALEQFVDAIGVVLELVDTREELAVLQHVAEHDRIARDLHDTVIQRLFGMMLRLESVLPATSPLTRGRVEEVIDGLDTVIRDIRTTIFNLHRQPVFEAGVRRRILDEAEHVEAVLGFSPRVRFDGPIDSSVPAAMADELISAVRELLSNVVRHAGATDVEVQVRVDDGTVAVVIHDDGVGLAGSTHGLGLANLRRRAAALGGRFVIESADDGGVVATFAVPVPAAQ